MKLLTIIALFLSGLFGSQTHRIEERDPINPGIKELLLLGDSVMAGIARSEQGKNYLARQNSYIFGAVGCQRISAVGCTKSSKLSSLDLLKLNSGFFKEAVVVATGYNDYNNASIFRKKVQEICSEANRQGVPVFWLTYREAGNVEKKSKIFYNVLLAEASKNPSLRIIDWNRYSSDSKGWFAGDEIHLQGVGPLKMAQLIAESINANH